MIAQDLLAQTTGFCALYLSGSFGWSKGQMRKQYKLGLERIVAGLQA